MKDNSVNQLGAICSILVGISYLIVALAYMLTPEIQKSGTWEQWATSYVKDSTMQQIQYWGYALGALFALAVVPAVSATVRSENEGWVRWTSTLAIIGFALTLVINFRAQWGAPVRAADYVAGDAVARAVVEGTVPALNIDPYGGIRFGGVGLWMLVVSILALRASKWPKPLAYLGIAAALLYWLYVVSSVLPTAVLAPVVAILGGVIVGPIWYVWMGLFLRRAGAAEARPVSERSQSYAKA